MKPMLNKTLAALTLAVCALPFAAHAQDAKADDAKKALAVKLAQIQQKNDSVQLAHQLVNAVAQPVIATWSQNIDQNVPADKQKDVREKLDVELKKLLDATGKTVEAQAAKTAESALVPVYMEKLSADELKTIVAYLESPASAKFQEAGGQAANAWAAQIINATESAVEGHLKKFDEAAAKIVKAATGAKPAAAAKPETKTETKAAPASASDGASGGIKTKVERVEQKQ